MTFLLYMGVIYVIGGVLVYVIGSREKRHERRVTIIVPDDDTNKFCRDCRWVAPRYPTFGRRNFSSAKCMHPTSVKSQGTFLATGQYEPDNQYYCTVMRESRDEQCCGEAGIHWTPGDL
jgi:hypothetical protein